MSLYRVRRGFLVKGDMGGMIYWNRLVSARVQLRLRKSYLVVLVYSHFYLHSTKCLSAIMSPISSLHTIVAYGSRKM